VQHRVFEGLKLIPFRTLHSRSVAYGYQIYECYYYYFLGTQILRSSNELPRFHSALERSDEIYIGEAIQMNKKKGGAHTASGPRTVAAREPSGNIGEQSVMGVEMSGDECIFLEYGTVAVHSPMSSIWTSLHSLPSPSDHCQSSQSNSPISDMPEYVLFTDIY